MITRTPAELSRIMWEIDPMGTCCNLNDGMQDEYDRIAVTIVENSKTMPDNDAMKQAILYWFDEYLYNSHKEELNQCLS